MTQDDPTQKLMDYLYGELAPQDRRVLKRELDENEELKREFINFLQLRELAHEHLPKQKVPQSLTKKVLAELGIRRPWYEWWTQGILRPSLVGAALLVLTLGISYQVHRSGDKPIPVATREVPSSLDASVPSESELKFPDMLLANRPLQPSLRPPFRSTPTSFSGSPTGRISLVGVNPSANLEPPSGIPGAEIPRLELEAQMAVAQYLHKQALTMRALGDFKGAAQSLDQLIKRYPFYPYKLQAMAQRIDCLFQAGESGTAKEELALLRSISPTLAYVLERRWRL